jgi:mannose-6-phosphate isomerase-like protein (cupin superfamily)
MTYDANAENARRYPRAMSNDYIESLPQMNWNDGIGTKIFLSRELDDARYFRHGMMYVEPDHGEVGWFQSNFDETQYCIEGMMRVVAKDRTGKEVVLEIGPGEVLYLPAGYSYKMVPTGVRSRVMFTSGPSPRPGIVEQKEYSKELRSLRTKVEE